MSIENFQTALTFTLREEGGFSDDPHDSGGATMEGISLREFRAFTGNLNATIEDLKAITPAVRDAIYQKDYWEPVHADELPTGIDLSVFDMGVNAGPGTSVKLLQRVLGVNDDGIVGPKTLAAAKADYDHVSLLRELAAEQFSYYQALADFQYFGRGWVNRNNARLAAASALLRAPLPNPPGLQALIDLLTSSQSLDGSSLKQLLAFVLSRISA